MMSCSLGSPTEDTQGDAKYHLLPVKRTGEHQGADTHLYATSYGEMASALPSMV